MYTTLCTPTLYTDGPKCKLAHVNHLQPIVTQTLYQMKSLGGLKTSAWLLLMKTGHQSMARATTGLPLHHI